MDLRLTGRLLTAACTFAVLTGGRGFCRHLRDKLTPAVLRQLPSWCTELLSRHDDENVWSESAGMPRAYGCEADHDADVQLASADEAEDPGDIVDRSAASPTMLFGSMTTGQLRRLAQAWREAPTRSSGVHALEQCFALRFPSYARSRLSAYVCNLAQLHGQCDPYVEAERVTREHLHDASPRTAFRRRFACLPIIPASGGCARTLCLLQQRSMLLGTEYSPMNHPPQLLLQWSRRLHSELHREARQLGAPSPEIDCTHSLTENVLCCFSKCVDAMLG